MLNEKGTSQLKKLRKSPSSVINPLCHTFLKFERFSIKSVCGLGGCKTRNGNVRDKERHLNYGKRSFAQSAKGRKP